MKSSLPTSNSGQALIFLGLSYLIPTSRRCTRHRKPCEDSWHASTGLLVEQPHTLPKAMKYWYILISLLLHSLAVYSLPTWRAAPSSVLLLDRANGGNGGASRGGTAAGNANTKANGGAGAKQKSAVTNAASSFAGDVATVSSSLNGSKSLTGAVHASGNCQLPG